MSDDLFKLSKRAKKANAAWVIIADPGRPPFRDMTEQAVHKLGAYYFD